MKMSINPRVREAVADGVVKVEHPIGSVNFASFERIIRGMKQGGEMPEDWNIIGVNVEQHGLIFIVGN